MDTKETWCGHTDSESDCDIRNPLQSFNLRNYLIEEIWQCSRRRNEANNAQEHVCGTFRNRVWKFLSIPQYFESVMFMLYGLLQCLDHLLMVYTFLPLRCIITFISFFGFVISSVVGIFIPSLKPHKFIFYATDARELVKFSFACICTVFLYTFDSSIAYHEIRTQSIIKIYIFFNLLEVADRLLSAVCLDAVDDVLFTVSVGLSFLQRRQKPATSEVTTASGGGTVITEAVGLSSFFVQYLFALVCLSCHCLLLLAQVTTLNVAFNSQNRSLLTVIISNNFVELKGNVFRKMGKSNLFQIACADVRERFHYAVWLFIIVCRNMSASGWQYDDFLALIPDILLILLAEIAVDWIKHAFISKFNVISSDVYAEYTVSIAYDLLLCRQGKMIFNFLFDLALLCLVLLSIMQNTSDYFELLSRRMGLTPISLSCLINVMIIQTVKSSWIYIFLLLALPLLFALKVLVHIILLDRAYSHVQAYTQMMTAKLAKEAAMVTSATAASSTQAKIGASGERAGKEGAVGGIVEAGGKRTTSYFYPPYTGYDQPTRDEDQLAMPQLPPRRSHSDTTCVSPAVLTKFSSPIIFAANQTDAIGEEVDTAEEAEEDFCSLQSSTTDTSAGWPQQKGILKASKSPTEARSRQLVVDAGDMQIFHRKASQLPSLSTSPTPQLRALDSFSQAGPPPLSPCSKNSCFFSPSPSHLSLRYQQQCCSSPLNLLSSTPLVTLSRKIPSSTRLHSRDHFGYRRRWCFSLDDITSISQKFKPCSSRSTTTTPGAEDPADMASEDVVKRVRFISRRRRHTENETSLLILEQLSSTLNDETAHLEGAVDVDLLSDDEVAATEAEGSLTAAIPLTTKSGEGTKNVSQASHTSLYSDDGVTATTTTNAETSVKQPLSNVDRYSMLGGQIS